MRSRRSVLWMSVLASVMAPLRARSSEQKDAMRSRIEADIRGWDAILDHRTGTTGDEQTAQWLSEELRRTGVEPSVDRFPFQRRVLHECYVAAGGQRADGVPLFDGGHTNADGLHGTLSDLESDGGIGLTLFGPGPWHPGTQALHKARERGALQAIVAVAAGDLVRPGLALLNADDYARPYGPPVLQVGTEHRVWLEEALRTSEPVRFSAHVTFEQTHASNVQAKIEGADRSLQPLVIMTPRSGWWTCTSERAGGITLWLELARHFAANRPDRTVIFTANTGHELGHVGLEHYLGSAPELVGEAHVWVHLGANLAAVDGTLRLQASTDELLKTGLAALSASGITQREITPVDERPLGEARNIYDGGGGYVSFLASNRLFHHPEDRWPEAVDLDRTVALNQALLDIVDQLARR